MSDASRHALFFIPEVTYGVTPDTPAWLRCRHNTFTVGAQRSPLQSEELRADRQIADFRLGSVMASGDLTAELSYGTHDALLEAAFGGTWTPTVSMAGVTFSVDEGTNEIRDSANGFIAAGITVGMLIDPGGFTTPMNNTVVKVSAVLAGALTVTKPDGSVADLTDEAAGDAVTIVSLEQNLKAGTTRRSFSFLRHFTDITATGEGLPYHLFKGVEVNSVTFGLNANQIASLTFGLMAREPVDPANSAPAGSTYGTASTTTPTDAFTGVFEEGGVTCGVATELSITLENGMEPRNVIGSKFGLRPSIGRSNATGTAGAFFEDASLLSKFIGEEDSSLSISLPDVDGNSYTLEVPRLKYTGGQPDVSGQGSITLSLPFQGLLSSADASNIILRRTPVYVEV